MGRGCVDKQLIIEEAAALANETGFSNVSLKLLSERLNIKAPSLYNHITNLEELKQELAAYGWEELTGKLTEVLQHGSVDTWVFQGPRGTWMAPALKDVFPEADPSARRIVACSPRLEEVAVFED